MPHAAVLQWFGGKTMHAEWIIRHLPHRCDCYVEPFGGGGSILWLKEPAYQSVYNDIDSRLVNFFRVLLHPVLNKRFQRLLAIAPYSRELLEWALRAQNKAKSRVRRAFAFYVGVSFSLASHASPQKQSVTAFSIAKGRSGNSARKWHNRRFTVREFIRRTYRVTVEHLDWRDVLRRYDAPETLFYIDPPYVLHTRISGGYKHEIKKRDQLDLIATLAKIQGMVVLSGYDSRYYQLLETLCGWRRVEKQTVCFAAGKLGAKRTRRTEILWINPRCWKRLCKERRQGIAPMRPRWF
jgi:DNA adenine methylase